MSAPNTPIAREGELSHQFDDLQQQKECSDLGMWAFLITEVLFFGGLFMAYSLYRWQYPQVFIDGSKMMDMRLGGLNTFVLLTSSLTMVFAVHAGKLGRRQETIKWLIVTMLLGLVFVVVKAFEYHHKWAEHLIPGRTFDPSLPPQMQIFFSIYFAMTGLHALHMIIGVGLLSVITWMTSRGKFSDTYSNPIEVAGLYWHFVDIVWIFLFPLLYLIGSRS